ncbi:hypothetical protein BDF14DRAFT_1829416 [Spinellus fusiger]|nr:hypothetical protein BDF14DRAFT_1829416 [Spinellus fusiger]
MFSYNHPLLLFPIDILATETILAKETVHSTEIHWTHCDYAMIDIPTMPCLFFVDSL